MGAMNLRASGSPALAAGIFQCFSTQFRVYSSYSLARLGFEISTLCTIPSRAAVIVNSRAAYGPRNMAICGSIGAGRSGSTESAEDCSPPREGGPVAGVRGEEEGHPAGDKNSLKARPPKVLKIKKRPDP